MNESYATNKRVDPGLVAGVAGSSKNYSQNVIFAAEHGHGFAAEKANHLADILSGKKAILVGGNIRDGADRVVRGLEIQTKYHGTGAKCIAACFRNGEYAPL